jgi:hypothetical protein
MDEKMALTPNAYTLPECWGCDTSVKIDANRAASLVRCPLPNGKPIKFIWRYVSLGLPDQADITIAERDIILNAGLCLLLVQHCNYPGWTATMELGREHGAFAAQHAALIEYPPGCHIALDLEGENPHVTGPQVAAFVNAWCNAIMAAGYLPCLYVGYMAGLTSAELYGSLPYVHRYWKDAGPRAVDRRGFCCTQEAQIAFAGFPIDPDHHQPDSLGGCLIGMVS